MREAPLLMNLPTAILEESHSLIRSLFARYGTLGAKEGRKKLRLLHKIREELQLHMELDEALFYPAIQSMNEKSVNRAVQRAMADHGEVKALLKELTELGFERRPLDPRMSELQQCVLRHLELERSELLPSSKNLSPAASQELGSGMAALRSRLRMNRRRATQPLRERNLFYPTLQDKNGAPEDDRDSRRAFELPGEANEKHAGDFESWGSE
jgi:hypothetical protein